eukprot:414032-Amphidinium_carterae.1
MPPQRLVEHKLKAAGTVLVCTRVAEHLQSRMRFALKIAVFWPNCSTARSFHVCKVPCDPTTSSLQVTFSKKGLNLGA